MARSVEAIPRLVLDERMFELAAEGVEKHAPDVGPLTWERFIDPSGWLNIPDLDGEVSKAELTLLVSVEHTVKLNVWFRPDIRGDVLIEEQVPHNHRWKVFFGHLIRGGFGEVRFRRTNVDPETGLATVTIDPLLSHISPTVNTVEHDVFHEIVEIYEPATMSLMVCDYGAFGD